MGIFRPREPLAPPGPSDPGRFRIRVVTEDGRVLYWHKRGRVHTLEEDVADTFIEKLNRDAFHILPNGTMTPPLPGRSLRIRSLSKEPA